MLSLSIRVLIERWELYLSLLYGYGEEVESAAAGRKLFFPFKK